MLLTLYLILSARNLIVFFILHLIWWLILSIFLQKWKCCVSIHSFAFYIQLFHHHLLKRISFPHYFAMIQSPWLLKFYIDLLTKCIPFYLPHWNTQSMKCSHHLWGLVWHCTISLSFVSRADVKMKKREFRKENTSSCSVLKISDHFRCLGPFSWGLWQEDTSSYITTSLTAILFTGIVAHFPKGRPRVFCCWLTLFIMSF